MLVLKFPKKRQCCLSRWQHSNSCYDAMTSMHALYSSTARLFFSGQQSMPFAERGKVQLWCNHSAVTTAEYCHDQSDLCYICCHGVANNYVTVC